MKEKEEKEESNNEEAVKAKKKRFECLKKKEIWISGVIGLIIGGLLIYLLGLAGVPGLENNQTTVATFKGGTLTKNELYGQLKKYFPISYVLEQVDSEILEKKYKLTDEQTEEINEQVESILNTYKAYGYTEDAFYSENGFSSKDDFVWYMQLDYRRNLYCIDYFKTLIPEEDIQDYYDNNVYGEISTKHMLVKVSDDVTEEQALATANEIISKLNNGESFDDVANEYSDKVTTEEVTFDNFDESSYESEYISASKALEKDKYTTEAVKTSYGYHVIYCVDKKDKPSLEESENDIVELLGEDLEEENQYIRYQALIKLREDAKLKFKDKDLQEDYEEYCQEVEDAVASVTSTSTSTNTTTDTTNTTTSTEE